jgi:GMP synthase-like glutamine amidotransferase
MKPIRIYRHDESVGPGYFLDYLRQHGIKHELIAIDQGDAVTDDFNNSSGLVFLGGDSSVNDPFAWIEDEINLIQQAAENNFPLFGHCFGAQLISKALGGMVTPMQHKEIGWFPLEWTDNSVAQEWFGQLKTNIQALHWHEYSLTIPEGAISLFGTKYCPNQAFAANNIVATTAHVEVTPDLLKQWVIEYGDSLIPASQTVQSEQEITNDLIARVSSMQRVADALYQRWFEMVKDHSAK